MNILPKTPVRIILAAVALGAVLYPLSVWFSAVQWTSQPSVLFDIFPAFGLLAFSTMWLHIIAAPFRAWLDTYINFERFVAVSSIIVLVSIILHPLLMTIGFKIAGTGDAFSYVSPDRQYLIWLAATAWIIFVTYDVLKRFRTRDFFAKHWQTIKFISTLGFFLILIHSLGIGRDLQSDPLRSVWMFYGTTAALAAVYTYGLTPFLNPQRSL